MNYYPFHLGDYASHTAHLDPMEDLAYRRMLDLYYMREGPLPTDWRDIARLIRLKEFGEAIEAVLAEFFALTDSGWVHDRCDRELAAYKRMSDGGKAGAAKRWAKGGDAHPIATPSPPYTNPISNQYQNQEPIPEPRTKESKPRAARKAQPDGCLSVSDLVAQGVDEQHANDWFKARKGKGAKSLTQTAWDAVKAEAIKAGLTPAEAVKIAAENSWQGFKAAWLNQNGRGSRAGPSGEDTTREAMRILGFLDDEVIDA
jgi:uncharacterized protein YdaU (DUF1376 family)